ncbi:MAG: hypothetical protein ACTH0V_16925 [Microbacteriaceae bacterium]|uniref:hypothetical protein n=1 Tax=unclassified Microbacterium TaxID=2609290 RepID=UPI00097EDA76|nr:hypothetical protein [Microbacterium sp. JB110]SJM56731.1 hypothetical protein CZ774_08215 [Frigoribacterium sp. JB110]
MFRHEAPQVDLQVTRILVGPMACTHWARSRSDTAADHDRLQALNVVLGVGVYTLSTYANSLTSAPVEDPFQAFA